MNLSTTLVIMAGGPGSGCNGPNCGRHKVSGEFVSDNPKSMHKLAQKHGGALTTWKRGAGAGRGGPSPKGEFSFPDHKSAKNFANEASSRGEFGSDYKIGKV
jgi:hypothetical protein